MDVTCERCHTEYEFDDALVSEQGTSVRCTQCGHKFRVKREGQAKGAPEVWVVRTVDGRELEFRAIRELKTAISGGLVSRDDVMSRGVGRPRRLASIAELEPFFSGQPPGRWPETPPRGVYDTKIGLGDDEPRPRSRTPQGLGPPAGGEDSNAGSDEPSQPPPSLAAAWAGRTEGSVAIPLPTREMLEGRPAATEIPEPAPSEITRQFAKIQMAEQAPEGAVTSMMGTPASAGSTRQSDTRTDASKSRLASDPPSATDREPVSVEPNTARRGAAAAAAESATPDSTPPQFVPARAPASTDTPSLRAVAAAHAASSLADAPSSLNLRRTQPLQGLVKTEPLQAVDTPAPSQVRETRDEAPSQRPAVMPPISEAEPSTQRRERKQARAAEDAPAVVPRAVAPPPELPREPTPAISASSALAPEEPAGRASIATPTSDGNRPSRESFDSFPSEPGMRRGSQTPTPTDVRFSISQEDSGVNSEQRLSALSTRGTTGTTRLIVGILLAGAIAFVLVLCVQRFVLKTPTKIDTGDQRIAVLLADGEKALAEGDLDGANDLLVKASAIADGDPHVAKALARLANARADVPWLRLRVLASDDSDRESAKREYAESSDRARKAVEKAKSLANNDAEVTRAEIDQKRIAGDVAGARKLVDGLGSVSGEPETAFVLGALDLAEESPPWPSIIDRLSRAASGERSLGRSRALLVYALAMSGDPKRARTELAELVALPRAHPLTGALKKFLDRVDKGEAPPLKVDDLPGVPGVDAGVPGGGVGAAEGAGNTLRQALEARSKGDVRKAENLYQTILERDPNNSEALTGLASLARSQGSAGRAAGLYQRVVDANPNYLPALIALADMKWDSGDRGTAAGLYSRAVGLGVAGAEGARAKERSGGAALPTSTPDASTGSGSSDAAPSGTPAPDPKPGETPPKEGSQ